MRRYRRQLLRSAGLAAAGVGLAGCNEKTSGTTDDQTTTGATDTTSVDQGGDSGSTLDVSADLAVAAEWNAYRSRLDDALALGLAGRPSAGATVAEDVFGQFESANGEYGAHEYLEHTSETNYEGFERALGDLRTELTEGNVDAAEDAWLEAQTNLRSAQLALVGEQGAYTLDALRLGAAVNNIEILAAAGNTTGAATAAEETLIWFEDGAVHDVLEDTDQEAYEAFESALKDAKQAASNGNVEEVQSSTDAALEAAASGAYAISPAPELAGAGYLAAMGAQGFDASVVPSLGGPSTAFAHATILTTYRARVHDAAWLAAQGETARAKTIVQDVFAHFETDRTGHHEGLEEADHEAYEGFESGLDALTTAIENGNSEGIDEALTTVDDNLVTGIAALTGETSAAILECAFFRARLSDARERYEQGEGEVAATVAENLFARFEQNEAGFHEALESTSEELYHTFEEEHLMALPDAYRAGDDGAVDTHHTGAMDALLSFETSAGSTAQVSAAESAYMTARAFDAAAVATLGDASRGANIVQSSFQHFEGGAGGFHEALEHADHETYETFEEHLGAVRQAANNGGDVYGAATTYSEDAIDATYAIVTATGGENTGAGVTVMKDTFGAFETADVHGMLEEADHDTYETFETKLDEYISALESGSETSRAATAFADATTRAQFAVVGAVDKAPTGESGGGHDHGGHEDEEGGHGGKEYSGGPNVVEGVPEDADHVVKSKPVSFEPKELTVKVGDKVAFEFAGGEPHTVTAYEDEIPDDAAYWASGDFDSQSAAVEGWENGEGAIVDGQSYVHTFETVGEHGYYCIPHEMAGMVGTIVVEE